MSWTFLYALDILAISSFAISYYLNCYRQGYRMDLWHVQLFLSCVLPNMLMLPFAGSKFNATTLNQYYWGVVEALPTIFLITLLGYFSVLAGGGLWRLRLGIGVRKAVLPLLDIVPSCSRMLMSSCALLVFQSSLCLFFQLLVLGIYFSQNGFGFDLRGFTFANPALRPLALVASNYSIVIASHCLARYIDKRERVLLACTLLLTLGLTFFGARSNILGIYLGIAFCYLVKLRDRVKLLRLGVMGVVLVVGLLYLGRLRAGEYSLGVFITGLSVILLYGDTFSDLRDFAWVYSGWNHIFWGGKTYLAAIMAFIPRVASEFRDTWSLGVVTGSTVGMDPKVHPGLRPGVFGEGFFNFGLIGVVGIGLTLGIIYRRVDIDVKRAFSSSRPSMIRAYASTMLLAVAGSVAISSSFSTLYILAAIYIFSWVCLRLGSLVHTRHALPLSAD